MGAIPNADLSGHTKLRDRANNALSVCIESQAIDFKESQPWDILKWTIIKTAMGMGNLRDGGIIIIGVSERDHKWTLEGISSENIKTYDIDNMIDGINKYASPPIDIDVVKLDYKGELTFLVIHIAEFKSLPIVCKRNAKTEANIEEGAVYIRPLGMAKTRKIQNAEDMHDLLELASEKLLIAFQSKADRVGYGPSKETTTKKEEQVINIQEDKVDKYFEDERAGL